MKNAVLALTLLFAPAALASGVDESADLAGLFEARAGSDGLSDEQISSLSTWIHSQVDQLQISDAYKDSLEAELNTIIVATVSGDRHTAWQAAKDLSALIRHIRAEAGQAEDRGVIGLIGGAIDLIKAVSAKDTPAIVKAVLKILWNLVL